jgi:hypothetical protein
MTIKSRRAPVHSWKRRQKVAVRNLVLEPEGKRKPKYCSEGSLILELVS